MKTVHFDMTCSACPEQYDGYIDGDEVAYLRLRHGHFRAEYKDKVVYSAYTKGDGVFEDNERHYHMNRAAKAILEAYYAEQRDEENNEETEPTYYTVRSWSDDY